MPLWDTADEEPLEGRGPVLFIVAGTQCKHRARHTGGARFPHLRDRLKDDSSPPGLQLGNRGPGRGCSYGRGGGGGGGWRQRQGLLTRIRGVLSLLCCAEVQALTEIRPPPPQPWEGFVARVGSDTLRKSLGLRAEQGRDSEGTQLHGLPPLST